MAVGGPVQGVWSSASVPLGQRRPGGRRLDPSGQLGLDRAGGPCSRQEGCEEGAEGWGSSMGGFQAAAGRPEGPQDAEPSPAGAAPPEPDP